MRSVRKWALIALVPVAAALGVATLVVSPASAATSNYIITGHRYGTGPGGVTIGVIRRWDGNYVHGNYDAKLPANRRTNTLLRWPNVEGFYLGPHWCAALYRDDARRSGDEFHYQGTIGPGRHRIGATTNYQVETYQC